MNIYIFARRSRSRRTVASSRVRSTKYEIKYHPTVSSCVSTRPSSSDPTGFEPVIRSIGSGGFETVLLAFTGFRGPDVTEAAVTVRVEQRAR